MSVWYGNLLVALMLIAIVVTLFVVIVFVGNEFIKRREERDRSHE